MPHYQPPRFVRKLIDPRDMRVIGFAIADENGRGFFCREGDWILYDNGFPSFAASTRTMIVMTERGAGRNIAYSQGKWYRDPWFVSWFRKRTRIKERKAK